MTRSQDRPSTGRRRRRDGGRRSGATIGLAGVLLAGAVTGCGFAARVPEAVSPSPLASTAMSQTLQTARTQVLAALSAARLQAADARTPYRTAESPALAAAPRAVVQVILPEAPDAGYVVVYELADPGTATAAAREFAQYLASGPGRIQLPSDAHLTLRQLGAALVFHVWSPAASTDAEGEEAIETTLGSIGQGYVILR